MHKHPLFKRSTALFLALCFLVLLNWNCGSKFSFGSLDEGKIIYDVTFPFDADNPYINIYPSEMTYIFKDGKVKITLASFAEVVTSEFIIDNNDRTFNQYFKVFDDKYRLQLNDRGVEDMVNTLPALSLKSTEEHDSLAGYLCNKTMATFLNSPGESISLYHTAAIDMDCPNWCNQYSSISEVLMSYEIEQFGKRMRLVAREVNYEEISDDEFIEPQGFTDVNMAEMKGHIETLLSDFDD